MPPKGTADRVRLDGNPYVVRDYQVQEVAPLADQIRQGSLTQADRANESIAAQDSWHNGFGIGNMEQDTNARYHYAQNIDARIKNQLILGPLATETLFTTPAQAQAIVQFIEFNSEWFAIGTRYVYKWNSGTGTWDTDKDMGATAVAIKGAATVYSTYLVVGAGAAVDYWRRTTAGVWDQPAVIKAQLMTTIGDTLWRVFTANQLSSSSDFTTWASAVSIGDANRQAVSLIDYGGIPQVGKPEGFFSYDGTDVNNNLPELAFRLDAANTRGGKPSRGKAYLPVGPALWRYSTDQIVTEGKPTFQAEVLAPGITRESVDEVRGSIIDLWPDVDFLWGILAAQSGNYYIVAYDYNPTIGQGWHQVMMVGTTALTALGRFHESGSNPRVWFSQGTEIYYFILPRNAQNPYIDTNCRYAPLGDIWLPVEADVFDDVDKAQLSVKIEIENVTTARYVEIAYTIDDGAETTLKRVTTDGLSALFFPSSTTGRRIALHLRLVTDDPAESPRVLALSRHFQLRFERKRRWTMKVVASRVADANIRETAISQITNLESARDTISPVDFYDKNGRNFSVFVESVGELIPQQQDVRKGDAIEQADPVFLCPLSLLEWRSGLGVYRYNSATTVFDDRAKWSNGSDDNRAFYS